MNVILIMMDTLRPDYMGCYGNTWMKTPNLDAFAKECMVFDKAVPEALPTLQVRRAMFTGLRVFPFDKNFFPLTKKIDFSGKTFSGTPGTNMPGWAPIPWDQATLAEMLQGWFLAGFEQVGVTPYAKYRTALISDTAPYFSSPAMNYHRGFRHYDFIRGHETDAFGVPVLARKWDMDRFMPPWYKGSIWEHLLGSYLANTAKWQEEEDHFAPRTFTAAIQWLEDSKEATDPFFLCIDEWDPHEPFDPPQHYVDLYDPGYTGYEIIEPYYGPTDKMTEKEIHHMRALYAGKVTMVDTWFGKFMDKVRELGLLENALIVITSDHGHQLGEHGMAGKVPAGMYNELMNCVLMIRHPDGIGAGQRSEALVQHQDICTTILHFTGVDKPPYELEGQNLIPILEGKTAKVRDYATCGMALNVWCRTDYHVLICRTTGHEPQLFDMKDDPEQHENIASGTPEIVKRLYDLILADAGGPILPDWKIDLEHEGVRWMDWSPFKEFQWHEPGV